MEIIFVSYILAGMFLMWADRDKKRKKSNVIYVDFLFDRKCIADSALTKK